MIFQFLKSEAFAVAGSLLVGAAAIAILKPMCKDNSCRILKAPSVEEIQKSTYQIGSKCFQFKAAPADCPAGGGVIEPFQGFATARSAARAL